MRAIIYALIFYPGTLLFVIGCWIGSLFGSRQMRAVVHAWTDFNHWLASLLGTRVEVKGTIPPGPYLIAVKHQSMFETLEMVRLAKTPIMVLKRELSQIPGFVSYCALHTGGDVVASISIFEDRAGADESTRQQ